MTPCVIISIHFSVKHASDVRCPPEASGRLIFISSCLPQFKLHFYTLFYFLLLWPPRVLKLGLIVSVGVRGFGLFSALRRPSSVLALCSAGLQGSLKQGDDIFPFHREHHVCLQKLTVHTHTHIESLATHSLTPPPQVLLLVPPTPRSLKPCLYCQRTSRHLPLLEHLVLSCWARTENSTIWSLMNCYFEARDKHTAL